MGQQESNKMGHVRDLAQEQYALSAERAQQRAFGLRRKERVEQRSPGRAIKTERAHERCSNEKWEFVPFAVGATANGEKLAFQDGNNLVSKGTRMWEARSGKRQQQADVQKDEDLVVTSTAQEINAELGLAMRRERIRPPACERILPISVQQLTVPRHR